MSAEAVDVVRQADVVRQLKIKTGSLKRVHKELSYYEKDREKEQAKLEKLKADGAPEHDIKQADNVYKESAMMIPETRQRLEAALADLQSFVVENDDDITGTEELAAAHEAIAAVEAVFK